MATIEELARRLERVEAELALRRLAHDYCIGADHRDMPRWASVWTADAVWETGPDRTFIGLDAICAAVQSQWNTFPIMQHATASGCPRFTALHRASQPRFTHVGLQLIRYGSASHDA
ncbi:nuclear transport factor 2 family protein [Dactylosporangium sp. CA-152071]|uniref:nuclear transport factor 2 family protein n=1 Tax=Dactylosporangium sp. CA-152071 TaxID=3239933 RepID=UPI003D93926A